jgi:hypothetical protein
MLLIVLITSLIAALVVPPCLITTIKVFSKFGALRERSYNERIWLQILKKLKEGKNVVREFRRCEERGHMFRCLVICINLVKIYYVHARARYILLSHYSEARSCVWRRMSRVWHNLNNLAVRIEWVTSSTLTALRLACTTLTTIENYKTHEDQT